MCSNLPKSRSIPLLSTFGSLTMWCRLGLGKSSAKKSTPWADFGTWHSICNLVMHRGGKHVCQLMGSWNTAIQDKNNEQSLHTALLVRAHNCQKWKSRFLACPCLKIYRVEAVGLSISNYTFKITISVCVIWGHFIKKWYFVNNQVQI